MARERAPGWCTRTGARQICETNAGGAPGFPVVLKFATEPIASQSDDGIGAAYGPKHPRLFQPRSDDGFATGLDYTRTNEQVIGAEFGVAHRLRRPGQFLPVGAEGVRGLEGGCEEGQRSPAPRRVLHVARRVAVREPMRLVPGDEHDGGRTAGLERAQGCSDHPRDSAGCFDLGLERQFDPMHNAVDHYFAVNGTLAGSWKGLDKDVGIVNWYGG